MKRTSIIWVAIACIAVLATVTTTYFLLDLKEAELEKRAEQGMTDPAQELSILNAMSKLREVLQEPRVIQGLDLGGESNSTKVTGLEMGTVKLGVPYELELDEKSDDYSKVYNSEEVTVSFERPNYVDENKNSISYAKFVSNGYTEMNKFIGMECITAADIEKYINSFDSMYDFYLELLNTHKDTAIYYETDNQLKAQFVKFYLASEIHVYDNIYKDPERKVIFLHDADEDDNVTGGYAILFKEDNMYEVYLLYNEEKTREDVERDFSYILRTM